MGWASYTARRELAPQHIAEVVYEIPLVLTQDGFESISKDLREMQKSISGKVETLYYGSEKIWSVTLEPINDEESLLIREFIESTADGQEFQFDPYGSVDAPRKMMVVKRNDDGAKETIFLRAGDPGGADAVQFSFEIRLA